MSTLTLEADDRAEFRRRQDVSYLERDAPFATTRQVLKHYGASALIYGAALVFYSLAPHFQDLLQVRLHGMPAVRLYWYAYAAYLVLTLPIYLLARPRSLWVSKNLLVLGYLSRVVRNCLPSRGRETSVWAPSYAEKHALAFLLIKVFYAPLMINSALLEYSDFPRLVEGMRIDPTLVNVCDRGYLLAVSGIFFLDSILFVIGYHTESGLLKNKLRYAETNVWHILVCIACYAPFNLVTSAFLGPSNEDVNIRFTGSLLHPLTWGLRGAALLCLLLMIWASLSLFPKTSNLTNRGIVQRGPYRFIRHPGYLAKNLFWLMTLVPLFIPNIHHPQFTWAKYCVLCLMLLWGMLGWGTIYFLRAITEERFLGKDPDYVAYCRKVKYRFIPGVY